MLLDEAVAFAMACPGAVRADSKVYVSFTGHAGRPRLVEASAVTLRILDTGPAYPTSLEHGRELTSKWITACVGPVFSAPGLAHTDILRNLEHGAAVFWQRFLPGALLPDAMALPAPPPAGSRGSRV